MRSRFLILVGLGVAGCATPGQVRQVETQVAMMAREQERRDSVHAAELRALMAEQRRTVDSISALAMAVAMSTGRTSSDFEEMRREVLATREMINQNETMWRNFMAAVEARQNALELSTLPDSVTGTVTESAVQLLALGNSHLNQGAFETARAAFQQLLEQHPRSPQVPDALYGIAESYQTTRPDSAMTYYREVANNHPSSLKAATAMYKLGVRAERANDLAGAKQWYQRIVGSQAYAGTPEYTLAREALRRLP